MKECATLMLTVPAKSNSLMIKLTKLILKPLVQTSVIVILDTTNAFCNSDKRNFTFSKGA